MILVKVRYQQLLTIIINLSKLGKWFIGNWVEQKQTSFYDNCLFASLSIMKCKNVSKRHAFDKVI